MLPSQLFFAPIRLFKRSLWPLLLFVCAAPVVQSYSLLDPFPVTVCGTWQQQYAQLHADILIGRQPPRYVISVAVSGGLAERLLGVISAFYYALLSGRALQLLNRDPLPDFESIFAAPFINWSADEHVGQLYASTTASQPFGGVNGKTAAAGLNNASQAWGVNIVHTADTADQFFKHSDLRLQPKGQHEAPYVFLSSNQGRTAGLFDNPHHQAQLRRWGLRPDLALPCAFHFLFAPQPDTLRHTVHCAPALRDDSALRIAISIVGGDDDGAASSTGSGSSGVSGSEGGSKGGGSTRGGGAGAAKQRGSNSGSGGSISGKDEHGGSSLVDMFEDFFECAQQIEKTRTAASGQRIVWYLTSNSPQLRRDARRRFGNKVVTEAASPGRTPASKVEAAVSRCWSAPPTGCSKASSTEAARRDAARLLCLSMADFHVVTQGSVLGRVGSLLSPNWHHVYEVGDFQRGWCGVGDDNGVKQLSANSRGV